VKNNKIILIITLILASLALVLVVTNKNSTIKGELKDFAIKDTNSITKIFIADRAKNKILLERTKENTWRVNNKYDARQDLMTTLLTTIAGLEVQTPAAKAAYNSIVKELASSGIKVEIYQGGDKPSKVYYVGGATQEQTGTFMLLENSSMPFVMSIPGFEGYLTTRFNTSESEWKDKAVFKYKLGNIQSITMDYVGAPESSFIVDKKSGKFEMLNFKTQQADANIDTNKINIFVNYFKYVAYELEDKPAYKDSILKAGPFCVIKIVDNKGITNQIPLFLKPNDSGKLEIGGKVAKHDVDHLYTTLDQGRTLLALQYYIMQNILRTADEFKIKKTK
jgi:hypothetical protein